MSNPIKFYRPDLQFAPVRDFPCGVEEHGECDGVNGPFRCPCSCHEMSDEQIAAMESEEIAA